MPRRLVTALLTGILTLAFMTLPTVLGNTVVGSRPAKATEHHSSSKNKKNVKPRKVGPKDTSKRRGTIRPTSTIDNPVGARKSEGQVPGVNVAPLK